MQINIFKVNVLIPDRMLALVVNTPTGPQTIWYGPVKDVPEDEFNRADEAHVSEHAYKRIAERAEATGKGTPVQ
jgi:hypothetical protein